MRSLTTDGYLACCNDFNLSFYHTLDPRGVSFIRREDDIADYLGMMLMGYL